MSVLPCILNHKFCSCPRNPLLIEYNLGPLLVNTVGNIFMRLLEHFCGLKISPRPESVSGIAPQLILISLTFLLLQMVMNRFLQMVLRGGGIPLVAENGKFFPRGVDFFFFLGGGGGGFVGT